MTTIMELEEGKNGCCDATFNLWKKLCISPGLKVILAFALLVRS